MFSSTTTKVIAVIVLIVVIAAASYIYMRPDTPLVMTETGEMVAEVALAPSGEVIEYTFACPDGKTFSTSYDFGSNALTLKLEGDVTYVLPQAVSASGARYALVDESVVFWEHQGKATVEVGGTAVHQECVAQV